MVAGPAFWAGVASWLWFFAVVGSVEPRAFEYYTRAAADKPFYLAFALGALLQWFIVHALGGVKMMAAFQTFISVSRHFSS
jgi:hypothetical protein